MMFQKRLTIAATVLVFGMLAPHTVHAQDETALKGGAFLGEEGCPGGVKSDDCILSLRIEGKAAQMLYDGLRDKAKREECTGGLEKSDGNGLVCNKGEDGVYQCLFGYHFKSKHFAGGAFSC